MAEITGGQQLSARYTVRERISEGPLGETWRALDTARDREVVLKVLRPEVAGAPVALRSLHAEIEAAARLDHPAIAGGYRLEEEGGAVFLVRDYVPGRDLSVLRAQSWRSIAEALAPLADGLAAMHAQGLVHRDLKSGNVILRPDGGVCLIDLGAAALVGESQPLPRGSPYSESPQQLAGEPPTPGDDAYAFGVLLYELLSGYPPFYPNITRERVLEEPAPLLRPVQPAPAELIELAMKLLSKDPAERPSLAEVAATLRRALEQAGAEAAAPTLVRGSPAIIRPIVRPAGDRARKHSERRRGLGTWIAAGGFLVLIAAVVGVFVALPRLAPPVEVKAKLPAAPVPKAEAPRPLDPEELERLAEEMDKAEQVKGAYESVFQALSRRGAAEWAAAPFEAGRKQGEEAARQFEAREFTAAAETYKAALDHLQEASDQAGRVLEEQLARGARALETGQSQVAQEAFSLALRIDPSNAEAKKGTRRAATLDRVFALVSAASNDEREQQWAAAQVNYQKALDLDADMKAASEGLARVKARIAADQFAAAISQGLSALNAGRLADARERFQEAGRIRPNAREVNDGLAQVTRAEKLRQIAAHREKAEDFERREQWKDALAEYEAALKIDPALEFARQGRDRAAPLAEIHRQLGVLLGDTSRLLSADVREQARALIAKVGELPKPGPVLRGQIEKLQATLRQVETPVRVALESDNATQILIHRVGALGVFDHREVELNPGHYTVVGTRPGYRDVRRELTVLPGQAPPPVVIRCEEPI